MVPLLYIGIKPIKVNGRKNYTTEVEDMAMTWIETKGDNKQERLDLHRIYYMAFFVLFCFDGGEEALLST